ncbi:hypothetical protein [Thiocystis violacea]|uniref:hypothetical protein n=1 Tax=Thiocystis violacea TaxID=13725 RepID=UPI0019049394|nr:hypothetical protein [Thiocystis violacea]MBK1719227.1 hypothetical protein [Thiocystis violacea]
MPNITITHTWQPRIPADVEFFLTCTAGAIWEAYPMADDVTAPDIEEGHTGNPWERDALNRTLIGPGVIWLRLAPSESATGARAVLSTWS